MAKSDAKATQRCQQVSSTKPVLIMQPPSPPMYLNKKALNVGILDRYIPLVVYDTACTSNARISGNPSTLTNEVSTKVFTVMT